MSNAVALREIRTLVMEEEKIRESKPDEDFELQRMEETDHDKESVEKLKRHLTCKKNDTSTYLAQIKARTKEFFDNTETLNLWHQRFKKKYPSGIIAKKKFLEVYRDFFGNELNYEAMTAEIFKTYSSGFESLSFAEFMVALTEASPGDVGLTVLALRMLDLNRDGKIRSDDVHMVFARHYGRKGQGAETAKVLSAMITKRIYKLVAKDINEVVPLNVFAEAALSERSHLKSGKKLELQGDLTTIHWSTAAILVVANKIRNRFSISVKLAVADEPTRSNVSASADAEIKYDLTYISGPNSVESRDSGVVFEMKATRYRDVEKQREEMDSTNSDKEQPSGPKTDRGDGEKTECRKRDGDGGDMADQVPCKKNKKDAESLENPMQVEEEVEIEHSKNEMNEAEVDSQPGSISKEETSTLKS